MTRNHFFNFFLNLFYCANKLHSIAFNRSPIRIWRYLTVWTKFEIWHSNCDGAVFNISVIFAAKHFKFIHSFHHRSSHRSTLFVIRLAESCRISNKQAKFGKIVFEIFEIFVHFNWKTLKTANYVGQYIRSRKNSEKEFRDGQVSIMRNCMRFCVVVCHYLNEKNATNCKLFVQLFDVYYFILFSDILFSKVGWLQQPEQLMGARRKSLLWWIVRRI